MTDEIDDADVIAAFEGMRILHPRLSGVHKKLDMARKVGRLTPMSPQRYVEFFAPSHSGKSKAITTYIENKVVDEVIRDGLFPADMDRALIAKKQKRVLHVTLSENASVRSMAADILTALEDPKPDVGDGPVLIRRVYEYLNGTYKDPATGIAQGKQTELVVLDEIQHLGASKTSDVDGRLQKTLKPTDTRVSDTLKLMMIRGLVPMVFVGIPEARRYIEVDTQLTNREMGKIDYSPLRWSSSGDQEIFVEYCVEAAGEIKVKGLLAEDTDLTGEGVLHRLWAASQGCIGIVSRILEEAVIHSISRRGTSVHYEDLALAVDTRAIPQKMCDYNPFREGVREAEVGKPE